MSRDLPFGQGGPLSQVFFNLKGGNVTGNNLFRGLGTGLRRHKVCQRITLQVF